MQALSHWKLLPQARVDEIQVLGGKAQPVESLPNRRFLAAIHPKRRGNIVCDTREMKTIR